MFAVAAAGRAQTPGARPLGGAEVARRIDLYVQPLVDAGDLSGTLLVARGGTVLYERSFGMASYALEVPNSPTTKFGIASVTKPLTEIIVLTLVAQDSLDLAAPLARWIPDFPRGDEITVEHLLRHRSGIPHRVTSDLDVLVPQSAADMVALASKVPLQFEPGTRRGYSSAGYSVLARVLELASGRSYAELLDELVLSPAGAAHSLVPMGRRPIPGRAVAYLRGGAGPITAPYADLSFLVGAGSVFSTPRDLFRILRTLVTGGYGEPVRRALAEGGEVGWHGFTYGYRAFVDYRVADSVAVIFAGNLFTHAADLIRRDVPTIVAGHAVAPPAMPQVHAVTLPPETRRAIEGIYQWRPGAPDSEEELRFDPTGTQALLGGWVLIPLSPDSFFLPEHYAVASLDRTADGKVRFLEYPSPEGEPFRLPRVRALAR